MLWLRNSLPMIRKRIPSLRDYIKSNSGAFVVMFALALVPIGMAGGAAIDIAQAIKVRNRLSQALDAAGLAAGSSNAATAAQMAAIAQNFFDANYPAGVLGAPGSIQVAAADGKISLSASADVNTTLLKLVGLDSLNVSVETEITIEQKNIEIVMVLDNTGSMNSNGKMAAMQDAATELVNIMFGSNAEHPRLKMALVPFVTTVNVKSPGVWSNSWMDLNAEAEWHGVNFEDGDGNYALDPSYGPVNHFDLFNAIEETDWKGCVEARAEPYDTNDAAPTTATADTLFVPWFWPDAPDGVSGISNNYITFPSSSGGSKKKKKKSGGSSSGSSSLTDEQEQQDITHYTGTTASIDEVPYSTKGPNMSCPRPILPLTNKKADVLSEISKMSPHGGSGTNISLGMMWGIRTISPTEPFSEGGPYNDPEVKKAIILLTDGENVVVNQNSFNDSDYNGYNFLSNNRLGTTNNYTAASKVNDKLEEVCEVAHDNNITVYTIMFQLNNTTLENLFKDCATKETYFFNSPTNEDLKVAFKTIASNLTALRISK